jgi:endonuclease IV
LESGYPPHLILPHGSYLGNLGSGDQDQRDKSLQLLVEELNRSMLSYL